MRDVSSVEELKKKVDDLEQTVTLLKNSEAQFRCLMETVPKELSFLIKQGK